MPFQKIQQSSGYDFFGGGGGGGGIMGCCCFACCMGCWCGTCYGFCSECVCTAACNPVLCSNCMTGDMFCGAVCTPMSGSGTAICAPCTPQCQYLCCEGFWPCSPNSCGSTDQAVLACALYAGADENGNDIYQLDDGSLVYSDGSAATQADIACNEGACAGTVCFSPGSGASPKGGNSGRGTAAPSGGGGGMGGGAKPSGQPPSKSKTCCAQSKLTAAMSKLGSTLTSLLSGGKRVATASALPGQKVTATPLGLSPNTFGLVVIIIGGLLLWMAFGHKPVAD